MEEMDALPKVIYKFDSILSKFQLHSSNARKDNSNIVMDVRKMKTSQNHPKQTQQCLRHHNI